jgi:hypothetical protein
MSFAVLLSLTLLPAAEWQVYREYDDGVVLEKRRIDGQRFDELRVSKRIKMAPKDVADSVWRMRNEGWEFRSHKKRQILRETPTERLIYSQLLTPIVSDRDYTVLQRRMHDAETGVFQILFHVANDQGPPPNPDHVRIEIIRGAGPSNRTATAARWSPTSS